MRIAAISATSNFPHKRKEQNIDFVAFRSSRTFLDYDALIWNIRGILDEFAERTRIPIESELNPNIDFDYYMQTQKFSLLKQHIKRRDEQLSHMLNLGRVIFVLLPPPLLIKKNAIDLDDEVTKDLDLLDNFNCLKIETIRCNGKNVEFRGEEPFLTFWEKTKSYYEYNAHFTKVPGTPLFYIKGTELVVGSYLQVNNGHVIYIPAISIPQWEAESEKTAGKIFDAFHELVEKLKVSSSSVVFQLPEWSSNYLLPSEKEQEGEIRKFEEELANLLETLDEKKRLLEELKQKKLLFAGIGNPLELKVKEIFELLGFETLEVAPNRDDLILKYRERIMVVEVKGITKKSAAEKHAAQLEKWVSDYHYKHEIKPKGVLIANTYSDLPLIERKETSFPAQMLPFSQARAHCLLTGLQLLCLYLDCKDDNEKKMRMIDLLFSTSGIFHEYQDWTKYIAGGA